MFKADCDAIVVRQTRFPADAYLHLATVRSIECVRLRQFYVRDACELLHAVASRNSSRLESLVLRGLFLSARDESPVDVAESLVRVLARCASVTRLCFDCMGFEAGSDLAELLFRSLALRPQQLVEFSFESNCVRDDGIVHALPWLRANTSLRSLNLSYLLVERLTPALLLPLERHPRLESLTMHEPVLWRDAEAAAIVRLVERNTVLRSLDLQYSVLQGQLMAPLCDALARNATLTRFSISCANDVAGGVVCDLVRRNSTLESLRLPGLDLDDASDAALVDALRHNRTLTHCLLSKRRHAATLDLMERNRLARLFEVSLALLQWGLPPFVVLHVVDVCPSSADAHRVLRLHKRVSVAKG